MNSVHYLVILFACSLVAATSASFYGIGDDAEVILRPRKKAPLFKAKAVIDDSFIDIDLQSSIDEEKWTVLLFYPFDYTFVCPTEIISFSSMSEDFAKINTKVYAISTDSHHTHLSWTR